MSFARCLGASLLLLSLVACRRAAEEDITPACADYVAAYDACLTTLQGSSQARARRVGSVRESVRLRSGASDADRAAASAKCATAKGKLAEACL